MFCNECGANNTSDANFCKQCGRRFEKTAQPKVEDEQYSLPEHPDERVRDLLLLAFSKKEIGELDESIKACTEALAINPSSTDAHSLMSSLYERKGDIPHAIEEREKVLVLNPGSIADREKLEQMRDANLHLTPKKITSSRRLPSSSLFDNPGAVALIAIAITLFILMVGAGIVWSRSRHAVSQQDNAQVPSFSVPVQANSGKQNAVTPPAQMAGGAVSPFLNGYSGGQNYSPYQGWNVPNQFNNPTSIPQSLTPPASRTLPDISASSPPPSTLPSIHTGSTPPLDHYTAVPMKAVGNNNQGSTVHLPDSSSISQQDTVAPLPAPSNPPGRIDIQVLPDNGSAPPSRSNTQPSNNNVNMSSQSSLQIAQTYQRQGQYQQALKEYTRSLDGADEGIGAFIQQQMALCYQRLGDNENAVAHYKDAISLYQNQLNAGRNTDVARAGIQTCQAGIRACQ
jgi:tetratricopeptide (TPR) repeat protein